MINSGETTNWNAISCVPSFAALHNASRRVEDHFTRVLLYISPNIHTYVYSQPTHTRTVALHRESLHMRGQTFAAVSQVVVPRSLCCKLAAAHCHQTGSPHIYASMPVRARVVLPHVNRAQSQKDSKHYVLCKGMYGRATTRHCITWMNAKAYRDGASIHDVNSGARFQ